MPLDGSSDRLAPYQWGALGTAGAALLAIVLLDRGRSGSPDPSLIALAWVGGSAAVLVAAGLVPALARRWRAVVDRRRSHRPTSPRTWLTAAAVIGVVGGAAALRLVRLAHFPRVVDADGMGFALVAREIADGRFDDPFGTGYLDHPALWSYLQRTVMAVTGESLAGARTASALVGTAAVAATIAWGRRIGGWSVGLVAGALLATSPMHLHFSRLALNNVTDSLALPLALLLVDRAVVDRSRLAGAAAGITIGLAQYGYVGARVLVPLTTVVAVLLLVRAHRRGELGPAARPLGWLLLGVAITTAPLVMHYASHPQSFTARDTQVSIFEGWLDAEVERTGDGPLRVLGAQAIRAALLPALDGQHVYHPAAPLVGWTLLIGAALGVGVLLAGLRRDRHAGVVLVAWIVPLAGVGTTIGLASHRWVVGTPVVAVTAAIGFVGLGRVAAAARRRGADTVADRERVMASSMVIVVLVAAAIHVPRFFRESNAIAEHGDLNSLVATELADDLDDAPDGTIVLAALAPRMGTTTHHTLPFLAPHVAARDLDDPIRSVDDVPTVPAGTWFVFLPERLDELVAVRSRYPAGVERTVVVVGHHLYTTYRVGVGE